MPVSSDSPLPEQQQLAYAPYSACNYQGVAGGYYPGVCTITEVKVQELYSRRAGILAP